ncbi:MAG: HAD family hydrolase [Eubacteriales bacterium]|nr:HAD family hydrolase [Eubacteriales bacterium]
MMTSGHKEQAERMPGVKWLFFDVGSTLVDESAAYRSRVRRAVQWLKAAGRDVTQQQFFAVMMDAARVEQPPFATACARFGVTQNIPYDSRLEKPYADAAGVLEALHERYAIGVIANQPAGTADRLRAYGLARYIDLCVSSAEAGVSKTDLAIFRLALQKARCASGQAVMIGDRLDNDIYPAQALGMHTIRIRQGLCRGQQPCAARHAPTHTVDTLSMLPALLCP